MNKKQTEPTSQEPSAEQAAGQQPEPTVVDPGATVPPADAAHQGEVTPPASEVSAPTEVSTDAIPKHILEENAAAKEMLARLSDPEVYRAYINSLAKDGTDGDNAYPTPSPSALSSSQAQPLAQPAQADAEPVPQNFMPAGSSYEESDANMIPGSPSALARTKAAGEKTAWIVRQEIDQFKTEFTREQQAQQNQAWQRTQVEQGVLTVAKKHSLSEAEITEFQRYVARVAAGGVPVGEILESHYVGQNIAKVIELRAQKLAAEMVAGVAPGATIPSTVTSPGVGGSAESTVPPGEMSATDRIINAD